jgi:hypothetical protein
MRIHERCFRSYGLAWDQFRSIPVWTLRSEHIPDQYSAFTIYNRSSIVRFQRDAGLSGSTVSSLCPVIVSQVAGRPHRHAPWTELQKRMSNRLEFHIPSNRTGFLSRSHKSHYTPTLYFLWCFRRAVSISGAFITSYSNRAGSLMATDIAILIPFSKSTSGINCALDP